MSAVPPALAVVLVVSLLLGSVRILRGPTSADRILAGQIFGTTGVGIILLLGEAENRLFWDVALVFALLAAVTTIAFAQRLPEDGAAGGERDDG
jgi:multicomponent Na+:H+ antiporter subunit F